MCSYEDCLKYGSPFCIGGKYLDYKEKALLNVQEFCDYLGIGQTKARELMTKTNNNYTVRLGNRLYANKIMLDKWLVSISGNKVS